MTNRTMNRQERTASFVKRVKEEMREERSSFGKVFVGMIIIFIGIIAAIFVLSGNDSFFIKHFGEDSRSSYDHQFYHV